MKPSFVIHTKNGNIFDPKTGHINKISINDIAHALSNLCRYAGHCRKFYSVAEHSVLTYKIAKKLWPDDKETQWAALLHDATEAYVGDVPTPLKILLPEFALIEDTLQDEIASMFNINWCQRVKKRVKQVDKEALSTEARILFLDTSGWLTIQNIDYHPELLSKGFPKDPESSIDYFMHHFNNLRREMNEEITAV